MTKMVTIQAQQRWDYCFEFRRTETSLVLLLNELGQQGWELVNVLNYKDPKGVIAWGAFMKRPNAGTATPNGQPVAAASTVSPYVPKPIASVVADTSPPPQQGFDLDGDDFPIQKEPLQAEVLRQ
jgi:hypothetical protein